MRRITAVMVLLTLLFGVSGCSLFSQIEQDAGIEKTEQPQMVVYNNVSNNDIILRIGVAQRDTFNPLVSQRDAVRSCMEYVYEPLFRTDTALRPVGVLAESASRSADGKTLALRLKDGVTWHDGSLFGAADVVYTVRAIADGNTAYSVPHLIGAAAADGLNVSLYFDAPVINAVSLLTFPIVKNGTPLTADASYIPVGTGEFCYDSKISVNEYRFIKYYNAHAPMGKYSGITVVEAYDNEKLENMFRAGELDRYTGEAGQAKNVRGTGRVESSITGRLMFLGFNRNRTLFADKRVRQAVASVINKEEIVNTLIYGRAVPSDVPVNPWSWVFEEYDNNIRMYSPDKAQRSMIAAGMEDTDKGTFRDKRGNNITVSILVNEDDELAAKAADSIAVMLVSFGVGAQVDGVGQSVFESRRESGDHDMFIARCDVGINMDISKAYEAAGVDGYDEETAAALSDLSHTDDAGEIYRLYGQLADSFKDDMPFVPLFFMHDNVFYSGRTK